MLKIVKFAIFIFLLLMDAYGCYSALSNPSDFVFLLLLLIFTYLYWHFLIKKKAEKPDSDSMKDASSCSCDSVSAIVSSENSLPTFGKWDSKIHNDPDQIKRCDKALDAKYVPIILDRDGEGAYFKGSKGNEYATTLDDCQCMDFRNRKLPCKHMYRLAMELGYFPAFKRSESENIPTLQEVEDNISVSQVLEMISSLPAAEQRAFGYVCYCCGNENKNGPAKIDDSLAEKLVSLGLVYYDTNLIPSFNVMNRNLLANLYGDRFSFDAKMKKSEIVNILSANLSMNDIPAEFRRPYVFLSPKICHEASRIHRTICKMYP